MAPRFLLMLIALSLLLPLGCNKKNPKNREISVGKQFSIDPFKRRTSTLLDRVTDETNQGEGTNRSAPAVPSAANDAQPSGTGLFAFGSGGVDDLQVAAKSEDSSLDLRLLETESVDATYKLHFDRGEDLLRRGQFDQALICFDEAKSISPKNYSAYVGEAFSYYRKGDFGRAAAAIDYAIRTAPHVIVLYNHRAHIRSELSDFTRAIDDLTHVLKLQPEDISSLLSRANLYTRTNNHSAALADYSTALKLKPGESTLLLNRAVSYFKLGKFKEAAADASAVIEIRRDLIDPFFLRAICRANLNDLNGGRSDFDEAVKLGLAPNIATMWRPRFYANDPKASGS